MRGIVAEDAAFLQRFHDQRDVALLEIAHAAVNELGGAAGGALAEVALLEQADGVAARRGIDGDADAGRPAADNGHVPGGVASQELLDGLGTIHIVRNTLVIALVCQVPAHSLSCLWIDRQRSRWENSLPTQFLTDRRARAQIHRSVGFF